MTSLACTTLSPSGKWSKDLGNLLRGLVRAFTKQVAYQGPSPWEPWQAVLTAGVQSAFVEAVVRLASRAQFSKDKGVDRSLREVSGGMAREGRGR